MTGQKSAIDYRWEKIINAIASQDHVSPTEAARRLLIRQSHAGLLRSVKEVIRKTAVAMELKQGREADDRHKRLGKKAARMKS